MLGFNTFEAKITSNLIKCFCRTIKLIPISLVKLIYFFYQISLSRNFVIVAVPEHDEEEDEGKDNDEEEGDNYSNHIPSCALHAGA